MTCQPDPDSLRERKRRATMVAIENAATSLVLENGYDAVTVDEICAAADVSKRTFFNYVPSKEAAVVGQPPDAVPDDARRAFLGDPDPDVPRSVLRLFLAAFAAIRTADDSQTATLIQRRRQIFRTHPELGAARVTASSRFQARLVELVTEHLTDHPALRRLPGVDPDAESRACVAVVFASVNLGLSAWLTRESTTFDDLHEECYTALGQLALLVSAPSSAQTTHTTHTTGSPA